MVTRFKVSAAALTICLPTAVEPVSEILRTTGEAISVGVMSAALPVKRPTTPTGTPASWQHLTSAMIEPGVSCDGRQITEQPAASAGATLRAISATGKFHAAKAATTPTGW